MAFTFSACSTASTGSETNQEQTTETAKKYTLGSTIETESGVTVKLVSLKTSKGQTYVKPDGDQFLLAGLEIVNNSDDEISVSSLMSFDLSGESGTNYDVQPMFQVKSGLDGTIKAGRKMVGQIVFDISKDSLYYLTFKPSLMNDGVEFEFTSADFAG